MLPKVTINYELEYKGRFSVAADAFDGIPLNAIEREVRRFIKDDMAANVTVHIENMPAILAEITEGLKLLAVQRAEEEL